MTLETFADIKNEIARKANWTDSSYAADIDGAANAVYKKILTSYDWPDRFGFVSWTPPAQTAALPAPVHGIIAIKDAANKFPLRSVSLFELSERYGSDDLTSGGVPGAYALLGARSSFLSPPTAQTLNLASTSATDITQSVRIAGYVSGVLVEETVMLTGVTSAVTTNTYDEVLGFAKSAITVGTVSLRYGLVQPTTISAIPAGQKTVKYQWVKFSQSPAGKSYDVYYERFIPDMVNDNDTPALSGCQHVIVYGGLAEILKNQRQFAKAQAQEQSFEVALEDYASARRINAVQFQIKPDSQWLEARCE